MNTLRKLSKRWLYLANHKTYSVFNNTVFNFFKSRNLNYLQKLASTKLRGIAVSDRVKYKKPKLKEFLKSMNIMTPNHTYNLRPRNTKTVGCLEGRLNGNIEKVCADSVIESLPMQTLKNLFSMVADGLNSKAFLINEPNVIEVIPSIYLSTFKILWPKPLTFSSYGVSKIDASRNAAKTVMYYLKNRTFMDCCHRPILGLHVPNVSVCQTSFYSTSATRLSDNKTEEVETIKSLFPHPKGVLHNTFVLISNELKQRELQLTPVYKTVKQHDQMKSSMWECTYNLKWPEVIKFSATSSTKQDASYKAAIEALIWLHQNQKINAKGQPNIYEKGNIRQLTKTRSELKISDDTYQIILQLLKYSRDPEVQNLFDKFVEVYSEDEYCNDITEEWPESDLLSFRQRYRDLDFYKAKESVQLPISSYKENLISLLKENSVVIIKGEPGCGKSTRVPQYVLEAWSRDLVSTQPYSQCRIIVTQPRRIAAVSLAERVAYERDETVGPTVGYHIRLKSNFNKKSGNIMYCTTGILLNRLQTDPKLSDCSYVILDEAHERDVNVDLLMNLLRHTLNLNPKLKLIVMSATLDANMFQQYFYNAPILEIPGFTYPVEEYFLTDEKLKTFDMCMSQYPNVVHEDVVNCIKYIHKNKPEGAILCFLPGWEDITKVKDLIPQRNDLVTLCLHSRLDLAEQRKIFTRPPPGVRKIILSTNIAETSITIDDVVYVVDTGIHKEERFDVQKGVICIDNHWISKSSAIQRKGRAGRCQPGECFHLYPESKFDQLLDYSIPEILRTSLTKIVLDSKVYSNNMNAVEFLQQLICPPDKTAIEKAVGELRELELLDKHENLTPLGRTLSNFQLHPKLGKAMVNAVIFKCVTPIVDIVTLFSAESALFAKSLVDKDTIKQNLRRISKTSDHLAMMVLFEKWLYHIESNDYSTATQLCEDLGLIQPKLFMLQKLRNIHFEYLYKGLFDVLPISDDFSDYNELIKAVLLSGVGTTLEHRNWDFVKGRLKRTNVLLTKHKQKATITSDSVNSRTSKFPSNFLVYINETISNLRHTTLIRESSDVSSLSVLLFSNGDLSISDNDKDSFTETSKSEEQVILKLDGSSIEFLCDRRDAIALKECKEVIEKYRKYYIYQLTTGNDYNFTINSNWNNILKRLIVILS